MWTLCSFAAYSSDTYLLHYVYMCFASYKSYSILLYGVFISENVPLHICLKRLYLEWVILKAFAFKVLMEILIFSLFSINLNPKNFVFALIIWTQNIFYSRLPFSIFWLLIKKIQSILKDGERGQDTSAFLFFIWFWLFFDHFEARITKILLAAILYKKNDAVYKK